MNEIEERVWAYIDGLCTPEEQESISKLIEQDEKYRVKHEQLLALNAELQDMEIDEPPMAFTYNVMEAIRAEEAQKPLKATINKKIIYLIAGFFLVTITALLIYLLSSINWSAMHSSAPMVNSLKVPATKSYLSSPVLKVFMFFDVIMALAFFDSYLRKRNYAKQE